MLEYWLINRYTWCSNEYVDVRETIYREIDKNSEKIYSSN